MTTISMAYGTSGYDLTLDDQLVTPTVIAPADPPALTEPVAAIVQAMRQPIGGKPFAQLSSGKKNPRVVIAIADHTRPVPDHLIVPALVAELGVPDECVTILIGTGTHRGSTPEEIRRLLGDAAGRFRVINHDCHDTSLVHVGNSSCGGECWLHPLWVQADIRLATGFIEPHFYAGFSGGSKAIVPGVAGLKTVQHFHRASIIADPATTWGDIKNNPLQKLTREMTALCPPHAIINVTLNRAKKITGVYAGEMIATHNAGCAAATHEAFVPVSQRFPVVITTNSGYPLDQNFYQTVKGISAAARIVERGGLIISLSRCQVGLPDEGEFRNLLSDPRSTADLHTTIKNSTKTRHDQWQVQTLLQCLEHARVMLKSELPAATRALTRTEHTEDPVAVVHEIARQRGGKLPVALMPLGPLTIPVVAQAAH
jgi:lactate racemase